MDTGVLRKREKLKPLAIKIMNRGEMQMRKKSVLHAVLTQSW